LINEGICYKNLQLFDEAIERNDKAIKVRPNDECGYFNKGMCLLKKIYSLIKTNFLNVKKKLCKDS
jgi:tetratricopeptide (TPR) repeat protein